MDKIPTKKDAMALLMRLNIPRNIMEHCEAVMRKARDLAHEIKGIDINYDLVKVGALIHDVGRHVTHDLKHGAAGGDYIRELGYSEKLAKIVERHVLGGLTKDEAVELGLPKRSFMPETIEEKLVCLADKYHSGSTEVSIKQRFNKWINKYGETEFLKIQMERVTQL